MRAHKLLCLSETGPSDLAANAVLLGQIPPLELLPATRRLIVPPPDRVRVHVCRYADGRVSQTLGNSRDLHPRRQQV